MNAWRVLDSFAHALHAPTMVGLQCRRVQWHHRIHLIPVSWLHWICDRYDHSLHGAGNNPDTTIPVAVLCYHCASPLILGSCALHGPAHTTNWPWSHLPVPYPHDPPPAPPSC